MTNAELLETITEQLAELEPQHVLQLRRRVARLAAMIEREDPVYRQHLAAGVAAAKARDARLTVIAQGQEIGQ